MNGMVFPGCAMPVVNAVSRSVIHWAGLILPDFAPLSEYASRNRWCLRALLKAGRVGMDDRWFGIEFQIFEATDENNLEVAMVVLRGGTHWQSWRGAECSHRYILWNERCKIGWLLKLEYSESNRSNFKANSVVNRKPMQIRKNRCDVAELRFLCNNSSKSILDTLKASQIWNGCASQERVVIIKSRASYCCSYGFRSLSSKRSTNVTQRTNMEKAGLACFRHLLIKRHFWVKVNTQIFNWCSKLDRRASNRDRSNRLSWSSKRFGSGVVEGNGLWLG